MYIENDHAHRVFVLLCVSVMVSAPETTQISRSHCEGEKDMEEIIKVGKVSRIGEFSFFF